MTLMVLCLVFISATSLLAGGACLHALLRTKAMVRELRAAPRLSSPGSDAEVLSLRQSLDTLAAQLHDLQQQPAPAGAPGAPRPGLNMSNRSQALRMNRRGDGPESIAAALGIPRQEVNLLLKVHRIVLKNIDTRPAASGV